MELELHAVTWKWNGLHVIHYFTRLLFLKPAACNNLFVGAGNRTHDKISWVKQTKALPTTPRATPPKYNVHLCTVTPGSQSRRGHLHIRKASDLPTAFTLGPTLKTWMTFWTQANTAMLHKPTKQCCYKKYISQCIEVWCNHLSDAYIVDDQPHLSDAHIVDDQPMSCGLYRSRLATTTRLT